jgi:uncharacterized membrane protein YoaK (UPF0700 family)
VFLHKSSTFGERYFGAQAALAALIIFVFPVFAATQDPEPMMWFLSAYLVAFIAARAGSIARRTRGEPSPHSFYTGTPRLMGRLSEKAVKGGVEPVVVWLAGAVLSEFSPLLAGYLAIAGLGLLVSVNLTIAAERKRVLDMHDAFEEQRRTAEDWRAMHRE